jgi:hypothetical protein
MIATPRFVFIHLHKSGGTFVNECLLRFLPAARRLGYHLPRSALPRHLAHLPVLGFVRNPWSYYVSWYSFQQSRPHPNALFRVLSDDGRLGFDGTITNMVSLALDPALLQAVVAALPARYTDRGLNLPGPALAPILGSGLGFYSYLSAYMFGSGDVPDLNLGRMESLRADLPRLLETIGEPMSDAFRAHVRDSAPSNVSAHGPYAGYYSAGLRDLVARRDATIIQRFGYRFDE